jgi:hypothetical protein
MYKTEERNHRKLGCSCVLIAVLISFLLLPAGSHAKTPDGSTPSEETVCSGLQGAAFGLCNAYCEAQDCDVHPRPSCAHLLANFRRITGVPSFPCDARCGDGTIGPGEDCDPPGTICPDQVTTCTPDCTCPEPLCGNGTVDPGEPCDPSAPFSICPCLEDCTCEVVGVGCCDCGPNGGCVDVVGTAGCPAGCTPTALGTVCSGRIGACVTEVPVCCGCAGPSCFQGLTPDECTMEGCSASPGFTCTDNGGCVGIGPAP